MHVISTADYAFGWPVLCGLAAMGARVVLIGPERDLGRVRAVAPGLDVIGAASAPRGWARSCGLALASTITSSGTPASVLACWDHGAFRAARSSLGSRLRVVEIPTEMAFVPLAVHEGRTASPATSRASGERMLLALGGGPAVDAFACVQMAGVMAHADDPVTLVLPRDAFGLDRAERFMGQHDLTWHMHVVSDPVPQFAADAAGGLIVPASRELSGLSISRLHSDASTMLRSGVPVVARSHEGLAFDELPVHRVPWSAPLPVLVREVGTAIVAERPEVSSDVRCGFDEWAARIASLLREPSAV